MVTQRSPALQAPVAMTDEACSRQTTPLKQEQAEIPCSSFNFLEGGLETIRMLTEYAAHGLHVGKLSHHVARATAAAMV
jgi:hypothetical protein